MCVWDKCFSCIQKKFWHPGLFQDAADQEGTVNLEHICQPPQPKTVWANVKCSTNQENHDSSWILELLEMKVKCEYKAAAPFLKCVLWAARHHLTYMMTLGTPRIETISWWTGNLLIYFIGHTSSEFSIVEITFVAGEIVRIKRSDGVYCLRNQAAQAFMAI